MIQEKNTLRKIPLNFCCKSAQLCKRIYVNRLLTIIRRMPNSVKIPGKLMPCLEAGSSLSPLLGKHFDLAHSSINSY